jgi:hypothetical protein
MERISDAAATAPILDLQGGEHPLQELWRERVGVVGFLRHFG